MMPIRPRVRAAVAVCLFGAVIFASSCQGPVRGEPIAPCTTIEGRLTISNNRDWATLVHDGCSVITGELIINAPGLSALSPPAVALTSVGGLRVVGNDVLVDLSLPALTTVGSMGLHLPANDRGMDGASPANVSLPALTAVVGDLEVSGNYHPTSLDLPVLATVGGALTFNDNKVATTLSLPSLATVGRLAVSNSELSTLSLPELATAGSLSISSGRNLVTLSMPKLTILNGIMQIRDFRYGLTTVDLPLLATLKGLDVQGNLLLTRLDLPLLRAVSEFMIVSDNVSLRQCVVDAINSQLTTRPPSYSASGNDGTPNVCP